MIFPLLVLSSALCLAGVAAYFSILGLTAIFPGTFWSIVVMGSALEVGKLITAVWLHRNWKNTARTIKFYLTLAVIILSGITSMGIFGFLSKSHIEQESGSYHHVAKLNLLNNQIESINSKKLSLIEQKKNNNQLKEEDFNFLSRLNDRLAMLDESVSEVRNKGGFSVSSKLKILAESQEEERSSVTIQKRDIQIRLEKYRTKIEDDIFPALNKHEEDLLGFNLDKSKIEFEVKKLESEIGPIKYIAEIISDLGGPEVKPDKAVRIVILILIFVFDPLAILLIVSASISFKTYKEENTPKDILETRNQLINELELHIMDGRPVETFIEKYQI